MYIFLFFSNFSQICYYCYVLLHQPKAVTHLRKNGLAQEDGKNASTPT